MSKNVADAYNLLEEMASNNYQWPSERSCSRKATGAYEIDALGNLIAQVAAQVAALSKKFDTLRVHAVQNSLIVCEMCGDGHSYDQCPYNFESVQCVGNFNRQQNNLYSNTYNLGWRNHPNFLWNNNAGPSNPKPIMPPGFQQQARPQIPKKKSQLEELLLQYMSKTDALIQSYRASLRNLETQVGQLANSINNRPQDALPNYDKAIVEKEVEVEKTDNGQAKNQGNSEANYPSPSFPQQLKKQKLDKQFEKFLNVFKKLHINIPFAEALENMPSYVKFLKDILTKKRKLEDFETVALTEKCSAIIQSKLPPTLKDPKSFSIPYTIGRFKFTKTLCDLSIGVSIIPLSIVEKLGLNEIQPTIVSLQLADRTIKYSVAIIKDVLVKVGHLYIPVDFIVLEMEEDLKIPLILGQPLLATASAIIDVREGKGEPISPPTIEQAPIFELKPPPSLVSHKQSPKEHPPPPSNCPFEIRQQDSIARLWAKLEKIYLVKSFSNKLQLRRKLYRLRMEENGNLMKHMNGFNRIIDQLKEIDVKVEDRKKGLLFLASFRILEYLIC
ncbi:PREDICTED: uncharacterized protein LOC108661979 [Theobroma cacao]|uniref:Uncharacterized protein LOC108661979 n=1 Tax=Theobroma cacao TaxID=3641 RepID=A0AB32WB47_THECC|nr:PREDICTED: uncharacterized protein LOC108661979 [Theobroma cacao]